MLTNASQNGQEPTPAHPLDSLVVDPTGRPPMCDEEMFASILDVMVADEAPRVFAIVQEYGERVDARIAAWGISFEERAVAFGTEGTIMKLQSAENALRGFGFGTHITPRLVWVNPDVATPPAIEGE